MDFARTRLPAWLWWLVLLTLAAPFFFVPIPAHAYTCEQVREYVQGHSADEIERVKSLLTPQQLKEAESCLRKGRHHV